MNPFRQFPTESSEVQKSDGTLVGPYEFIFTGEVIVTWNVTADLDEGDLILRKLPNGKSE